MSRRHRLAAIVFTFAATLGLTLGAPHVAVAQATSSTTTAPVTTTAPSPATTTGAPVAAAVETGTVRELSTSQFATLITILIGWTSLVWAFVGHRVRKARTDAGEALGAVEHLNEVLSVLDRLLRHLTAANEQQRALVMRLITTTGQKEKLPGLDAEIQAIGFDLQRSMLELVVLGAEVDGEELRSSCKQLAQRYGDWESVPIVKLALKRCGGDQDMKRFHNELRRRLKREQASLRSQASG